MASGSAWDETGAGHFFQMVAIDSPDPGADPVSGHVIGRILRLVLALLLAGSAILLAR